MPLTIDLKSDTPIYMQIRNAVVGGIASGELREGDPLPSARALGARLGVSLHTVNKAYGLLRGEGFVEMLRGRGAVIRSGRDAGGAERFLESAGGSLRRIVSEAATRNVDRSLLHKAIDGFFDELGVELK